MPKRLPGIGLPRRRVIGMPRTLWGGSAPWRRSAAPCRASTDCRAKRVGASRSEAEAATKSQLEGGDDDVGLNDVLLASGGCPDETSRVTLSPAFSSLPAPGYWSSTVPLGLSEPSAWM